MRRSSGIPITIFWAVVCVIVFILQLLGFMSVEKFALLSEAVKRGQFYRIVTGALMHGGFEHIFANMFSFINIGSYCELNSNKKSYLIAIILSMLLSGISVVLFSYGYTVGFSGVVFGVMGYFAILLYKEDNRWDSGELQLLARMIIPNIIISFMPGVSLAGHLGGFIGGAIAGFLFI